MTNNDYLSLKTRIETAYQKDLEALERIWNLTGSKEFTQPKMPRKLNRINSRAIIKEALPLVPPQFSAADVRAECEKKLSVRIKRTVIAQMLRVMADEGTLIETQKGKIGGINPISSLYRIANAEDKNGEPATTEKSLPS